MSVQDVLKSSFLKSLTYSGTDPKSLITALVLAMVFGLIIFIVYTNFYSGVIYSRNYAVTLIGMSVLTCMVTLAISTNVVISLGMVGSLSIIRYRTAIKDPTDLLYMFWAVTTGITCGAGMIMLAVISSAVMIVIIAVAQLKPAGGCIYVAVIHYTGELARDEIIRTIGRRRYHVKSQTLYGDKTELAVEIYVNGKDIAFFDRLREVPDVQDVTVIQYNGEYHG